MKNLKKIAAVVILALGTSMSVNAQDTKTSTSTGASFGFKGGLNISNMYTKDVDDENALVGFNAGIFLELPISSSLSLQPELLYSTKGAEVTYDNAFASGTGKFRLNYIEAPLLLRANVTENFNIHFGPYFAYLVDAKISNETNGGTFNFEEEINNDDLNKFDYGLAAGLGFDFDGFGIGARYNYGLQTIGKERTFLGQTYTFPEGKNSSLSVYATIKF
ncbi:porin family protein [Flavobacterium sp.]|uniref:porin family protein n=1 Tax=Flavobacterium sp. TaxID=239 RepID=UPI00261C6799|nr:porin family protein [Flavobacterium sp.]